MALHDWNCDGKKDWQDNFIEYQIDKETRSQNNKQSYIPSSGSNVKTGTYLIWYILALIIGYCVSEFIGVVMLVGLMLWACVN